MLFFILNRPQLSLAMMWCYTGLLRVREALTLKWQDVVIQPNSIVLCLGKTKRGMEQKVILNDGAVVQWFRDYLLRFSRGSPVDYVFELSYTSVLRWVRKLANLLGAEALRLTTHTFRRSGASELVRIGVPLTDVLLFGRWLRERSAREYIRQGEVAVLRARLLIQGGLQERLSKWNAATKHSWWLYDRLYRRASILPSVSRITAERFAHFESLVFEMLSGTSQC